MPEPRPPKLVLAEQWARSAGKPTDWLEGRFSPSSPVEVVLVVYQGPISVYVRVQEEALRVFVQANLPEEAREALRNLSDELKTKLTFLVRQALLYEARVAYQVAPVDLKSIEHLEKFTVEEILMVSEEDTSTMNRFLDAIVEVTVVAMRVGQLLSTAGPQSGGPPERGFDVPKQPPGVMYR